MLTSFEIKNFRTFKHLTIPKLGRVNLIVGKNNTGKTTLLEALQLWGSLWPMDTIQRLLDERDEVIPWNDRRHRFGLDSLFHNRSVGSDGPIDLTGHATSDKPETVKVHKHTGDKESSDEEPEPRLHVTSRGGRTTSMKSHASMHPGVDSQTLMAERADVPLRLLGRKTDGEQEEVGRWWDALSLTDYEQRVTDAVGLVAPVTGITFVVDPRPRRQRFAKVRIRQFEDTVPLSSLGDGAVRVFHIATAIAYAAFRSRKGRDDLAESKTHHKESAGIGPDTPLPLVLIDEFETGVHHTLHADLWRTVFRTAKQLDVQVFATTHSWDCLRAFQQAAAEHESEGLVLRLEREGDENRVVLIDEQDMAVVARDQLEVR